MSKNTGAKSKQHNKPELKAEDIIGSINDLLFFLDADGYFTDVITPKKPGKLFISPDEFIGKHYDSLGFPEDLVHHTHQAFENAKLHKEISTYDYSLDFEGITRWYNAGFSPLYCEKKEFIGMTIVVRDLTDQMVMKEKARQSELRYQTLINNIDGTVYSIQLGKKKTPLFYSKAILSLTGYSADQFISGEKKWKSLILPEYRSIVLALFDEAIKQKTTLDTEYEIKTATGEVKWVHERGRATYDNDDNPIRFDGYVSDITNNVLSKQSSIQKEQELTAILEATGTMIAIIEPNGKIGYANSRFKAITGYSPSELIGKMWFDFIPQSEIGWIRSLGEARRKGNKNIPNEYNQTLIHKNGQEISVYTSVSLLSDTKRQIVSISDLTNISLAQDESRQQQERFEKFINSSTEGFTLLDKNLNYLTVNETALKYFPKMKKLRDIIGKHITEVIPDIKGTTRLKAYYAVLKTGKPYQSNHIALSKNFNYRHISMKAFKVGDGLGQVFEDITERIKTEEKLRVSNQQHRTLISNLQGMVYRCRNDHNWTMEFVSDGVKKLTGYNSDDLIDNKNIAFSDLILPEYRDYLWNEWQEKLKSKKYVIVEYRIRRKDGKIRWVHEKGTGVFDSKDKLTHLEGYIVDITSQKEMQTNLEQSERRFRGILETMKEGYYEIDPSGKIIFCNNALVSILVDKPGDIVGRTLSTFFDASSSKILKSILDDVFKNNQPAVKILSLKYFKSKTIELSISPKTDDQNNVVGLKGILIDISERQKADQLKNVVYNISEAVHTSKDIDQLYKRIHKELSKVVDAANFYIAYFDEETNLLSFPYYKDEVDTFPNIARPLGDGLTEYVIRNGKPLLLSKDDIKEMADKGKAKIIGSVPEQWIASPLKTVHKTVGVIAMQSYREKNLYNQSDLDMLIYIAEQVAVTLERKLFETKLRSSEQKYKNLSTVLDESNQFKELIMDIVGHDLKTPAGVIQGFSNILHEEEPENEIITHIYQSSKNLVDTFNDLTVLNRTFGTNRLPMKRQSLMSIIETVIRDFQVPANENGMKIISRLKKDYQFIGNGVIIEVFKNYLSNAIKYASTGKKVTISTKRKPRSVVVLVSDLGDTIPEKAREKIFLRSVQLQKSSVGGIGLGLAIVSRIAHLHGYKVWVEENKPRGNSFCIEITLPRTNK